MPALKTEGLDVGADRLRDYQPIMSEAEQTTLLGFLAGYRGYTRDAYTLDLRQFTAWCWQHHHRLFEVRRFRPSPVGGTPRP